MFPIKFYGPDCCNSVSFSIKHFRRLHVVWLITPLFGIRVRYGR